MGLCVGTRRHAHREKFIPARNARHALAGPGVDEDPGGVFDLVVPARDVDVEDFEIAAIAAAPEAEIEPPAAGLVEDRCLLGELDGMIERRQRHGCPHAQTLRASQQETREGQCIRIHAEIDEMMLGHPDIAIAEPLREFRLGKDQIKDCSMVGADLRPGIQEQAECQLAHNVPTSIDSVINRAYPKHLAYASHSQYQSWARTADC